MARVKVVKQIRMEDVDSCVTETTTHASKSPKDTGSVWSWECASKHAPPLPCSVHSIPTLAHAGDGAVWPVCRLARPVLAHQAHHREDLLQQVVGQLREIVGVGIRGAGGDVAAPWSREAHPEGHLEPSPQLNFPVRYVYGLPGPETVHHALGRANKMPWRVVLE